MRKTAAALLALAALAAPAAAQTYPTHVRVTLTRIPGNVCCPKEVRASVSPTGVLTQYTMERGGTWKQVGRKKLKPTELSRLRTELRRFDPATLKPNNSAGCNGLPIGDVGGYDLKVGKHESNCPPKSATRLIDLMKRWLPAG